MRPALAVALFTAACGGSPPAPPPAPAAPAPSETAAPIASASSAPEPTPSASAPPPATASAQPEPPPPAGAPKLVAVEAPGPLKLSAPAGWSVRVMPPRHKDLSTIASISPDCIGGPDISVGVQLDQNMKTGAQLLADQYKGVKPTRAKGFDCVVRDVNTEVMCAGKLKGMPGVISLYFATTDADAYKRLDPLEFTSSVAASLSWSGKVSDLQEWRRPATPEGRAVCPKK